MKATLEFNLPEDQIAFAQASNAGRLSLEISDLLIDIRNYLKHGHNFQSPDEALEYVREHFSDVANVVNGEL